MMTDSAYDSSSPLSQFSIEDDDIVWTHGSVSDADFIVLRHPLLDARPLSSTRPNFTGHPSSDSDLSSELDIFSLSDHDSFSDNPSSSAGSDASCVHPESHALAVHLEENMATRNTRHLVQSSSDSSNNSASSEYRSGISTPIVSYDDASAFISRFISSPVEGNDAELDLLRALIIELGLRSATAMDFPRTLTSARKMLKAEAHVNIKEYVATRHKGQSSLREIMKPSKNELRKDIRKGNRASLQWVKQHGLRVLLVTCYS